MTWEIVAGIITLFGFILTVIGYSGKLSKALASLETTLKALKETLEDLKENNKESHKEFYDRLTDHESRIKRLETKHEND
jgi:Sec-independent protein translocase protein TatA